MSKTEKRIGRTSAWTFPVPDYHFTGLVSFLFIWFACAPLLQVIQRELGLSADQVTFVNIAAHIPALSISTGGVACLVLLLSMVGVVAGRLIKLRIDMRQPWLP